jgi:hypothetical protein
VNWAALLHHQCRPAGRPAGVPGRPDFPRRIGYWSRFDLVIIDGWFRPYRTRRAPPGGKPFYKVIDARSGQRSTALATNIDFEAWSEYPAIRPGDGLGPHRRRAILPNPRQVVPRPPSQETARAKADAA